MSANAVGSKTNPTCAACGRTLRARRTQDGRILNYSHPKGEYLCPNKKSVKRYVSVHAGSGAASHPVDSGCHLGQRCLVTKDHPGCPLPYCVEESEESLRLLQRFLVSQKLKRRTHG